MKTTDSTLAERLVIFQQRNSSKIFKAEMHPVIDALGGTGLPDAKLPVRRFRYLETMAEAVARTRQIPDKEILDTLFDVQLPCNAFWIEGAAVNSYNMLQRSHDWSAYHDCNRGFLCRLTGEEEILLQTVTELPAAMVEELIKQPLANEWRLDGKHVPGVETVKISRSAIEVQLNEAARSDNYRRLTGLHDRQASALSSAGAEGARNHASFFARAVVLLGSMTEPDSPWRMADDLQARREEYRANIKRKQRNSQMSLPVHIVTLDIAKFAPAKTPKAPQTLRDLLGKTWVKPSKPWRDSKTKQFLRNAKGELIRRRGHERRIAAPEDRTLAMREVTASRPVELITGGEYPMLKV